MSISDRLDEIDSVAPYLDDDDMEAEVLAATAALRAVLNLHTESRLGPDLPHPYCGECGQMLPCATRRVTAAALGEGP